MRAAKIFTAPTLTAVLALAVLACQPQPPAPEPAAEEPVGERVENATAGVAIAHLPAFFQVAANGDTIELVPASADGRARLTVAAGEAEVGGINLVEAVRNHKGDVLARPDGDYKGQQELGTPLGTAFYSRGRYTAEDGTAEEETVIFLVHPWKDRKLRLVYRYAAADDTKERVENQLFEVLGELEALPAPGEESVTEEAEG